MNKKKKKSNLLEKKGWQNYNRNKNSVEKNQKPKNYNWNKNVNFKFNNLEKRKKDESRKENLKSKGTNKLLMNF